MPGLILYPLIPAYAVTALVVARAVAGHVAWSCSDRFENQSAPSGFCWRGMLVGGVIGVSWPVAIPVLFVGSRAIKLAVRAVRRVFGWLGDHANDRR